MRNVIVAVIGTVLLGSLGVDEASANPRIAPLNELLRGEVSAVETYSQALEKLKDEPGAEKLRQALRDHEEAVSDIHEEIVAKGGVPSKDSGAWGVWAKTVTGSAKLLGDKAALKALKEGEEHGVKEYKEILAKDGVSPDFKKKVKEELLPKQQEHIAAIDSIMESIS